jgi:hypothetical protein
MPQGVAERDAADAGKGGKIVGMEAKDFVPQLVQKQRDGMAYFSMLVEARKCPTCEKWMVQKVDKHRTYIHPVFPHWLAVDQDAQVKRAGLHYASDSQIDEEYICQVCADDGKGGFTCRICEQVRTSDQEQTSYGEDKLCTVCYASTPAKEWDAKTKALYDAHKYDHC